MKNDYRYIVLGLGGIGSGAAYWLARRAGSDVLGIEQFELGHARGESQDHSRIIRLTYDTVPYVRLARQAYEAWSVLEEDAEERLILKTGEIDLWPAATGLLAERYRTSMEACGVPYEVLDAGEILRRFPQFSLSDDIFGIYQAEGGLAAAARCNAAHQRMARAHGATLVERTPVTSVRALDGGYEVATPDRTYGCEKLIVAAGPWSNRALAHFGLRLPLTVTQEQVTYVASPRLADFAPERFPVWIWMTDPCYYGFPVYGAAGVKIGLDRFEEVTPDTRRFQPDPVNERQVRAFLARHIPGAAGPVLSTKTCLLTLTPDRDFVIDRVPGHETCFVAVGAGHAFKFASVIGRTLSELALDGGTRRDISPFRIDRPALTARNPVKSWPEWRQPDGRLAATLTGMEAGR